MAKESCIVCADEGKELSSMEREFLKSLAETRAIEAKLTAEIRAVEGISSSDPDTRKGALALQEQLKGLTDRVGALRDQLASDRARFSALHTGWKVILHQHMEDQLHAICSHSSGLSESTCVSITIHKHVYA